jgi:hypothetical protein
MAGIPCCSVQITIGGKTESANFRLGPSSVDVNYVEGRMRADYGVVDGILSYDNNVIRSVEELEADNVYYFVRFRFPQGTQVPPQAGKNSSPNEIQWQLREQWEQLRSRASVGGNYPHAHDA